MLGKLAPFLALILISCATPQSVGRRAAASGAAEEIRYLSLDHTRVIVFSGRTGRSGGIEAYVSLPTDVTPPSLMREFRTADAVRCVSLGPPGNTIEFAVRRPIRVGDRYACLGTSFEVTHCTDNCRSAIIRVERSSGPDIEPSRSQMYVDRCRGLLIWSDTGDLMQGVPLDAFLLRDPVGILADPDYPACNWY
ncbi:MAG TPA: hypothetical protein VMS43_00255 [Allosphingosinicella sp.]|nr:hypothetical protein [Allosphingosinicella sp.]